MADSTDSLTGKKILHKRSNVVTDGSPKLPTADQLEYGEIAINYADGNETLSIKNSNNEIVTFVSKEQTPQANWNEADSNSPAYIRNKPSVKLHINPNTDIINGTYGSDFPRSSWDISFGEWYDIKTFSFEDATYEKCGFMTPDHILRLDDNSAAIKNIQDNTIFTQNSDTGNIYIKSYDEQEEKHTTGQKHLDLGYENTFDEGHSAIAIGHNLKVGSTNRIALGNFNPSSEEEENEGILFTLSNALRSDGSDGKNYITVLEDGEIFLYNIGNYDGLTHRGAINLNEILNTLYPEEVVKQWDSSLSSNPYITDKKILYDLNLKNNARIHRPCTVSFTMSTDILPSSGNIEDVKLTHNGHIVGGTWTGPSTGNYTFTSLTLYLDAINYFNIIGYKSANV